LRGSKTGTNALPLFDELARIVQPGTIKHFAERNTMQCSTRLKVLTVAALVIAANAADLLSTYLASPDLADEWNILQRHFNLGWAGLVAAKLIGGSLAIAGYVYYRRHRDRCYPEPGADFTTFRRHLSFGKQVSSGEMWRGIPVGPHLGVNLGYFWAGMQGLVLWVALDNMLLRAGILFPFRVYSELGYHLFQSVVVGAVVLHRFYSVNYNRYRGMTEAAPATRPAATPAKPAGARA
jgi:hypothetical protein